MEKPTTYAAAEKLFNVLNVTGNTAENVTEFTIKKGTQIPIGKVAGGEGTQIFLTKNMQEGILTKGKTTPLKK